MSFYPDCSKSFCLDLAAHLLFGDDNCTILIPDSGADFILYFGAYFYWRINLYLISHFIADFSLDIVWIFSETLTLNTNGADFFAGCGVKSGLVFGKCNSYRISSLWYILTNSYIYLRSSKCHLILIVSGHVKVNDGSHTSLHRVIIMWDWRCKTFT